MVVFRLTSSFFCFILLHADMPTQHGSARYQDHFPEVDAEIVGVLRNAGCLIMGEGLPQMTGCELHVWTS